METVVKASDRRRGNNNHHHNNDRSRLQNAGASNDLDESIHLLSSHGDDELSDDREHEDMDDFDPELRESGPRQLRQEGLFLFLCVMFTCNE